MPEGPCQLDACELPAARRRYCNSHYQRLMKYGDPRAGGVFRDKERQTKPCEVEGCTTRRFARRMCDRHYSRWLRTGDPLWQPAEFRPNPCKIDGCDRPVLGHGWCSSHYHKWRRHGDPLWVSTPEKRRRSRGRLIDGYMYLYRPEHPNARKDGRIAEHTIVMSEMLGRALHDEENVHHKNGIRNDNRPENLELWIIPQPPGQRVKDLIEFANWIRERYGEEPTAYP